MEMASETKTDSLQNSQFIDPEKVLSQVDIKDGMTVADFGCGTGYFSFSIARKIGDGVVHALDVLPSIIEVIASQAKVQSVGNIIASRVNLEKAGGSKLSDGSMDLVIIKDMLFQNGNKHIILAEAKRVLKDGGRAVIVEWKKEETSIGPAQNLRISREELSGLVQQAGFKIIKDLEAGDFHYGLLIEK